MQVGIRPKVVKNWSLHPIIERCALEDIFKRLRNGKLEGASRVLLPSVVPRLPDLFTTLAYVVKRSGRLGTRLDAEYKGH